jgi:hypothetical protein
LRGKLYAGLGFHHPGLGVERRGSGGLGILFFLLAVFRKDLFQLFVFVKTFVLHGSLLIAMP